MDALAVLVLIFGAYLVDSAVVNRRPVQTFLSILRNPSAAKTNLAASRGAGFAARPAVVVSSNTGASIGGAPGAGAASTAGQGAVAFAEAQKGKPYRWGATGPDAFDCSGLVQAAYKTVGVKLPRTTAGQVLVGSRVDRASLQIGDLVFPDPGHVQLYSGGGRVVEAPRTGQVVRDVPMWGFMTARRP